MANPNSNLERLRQRKGQMVEQWHTRRADINALPQLTIMGLLSGILAAWAGATADSGHGRHDGPGGKREGPGYGFSGILTREVIESYYRI